MILQPGSKLVMIGDSITDMERSRPVGEGLFGAQGKGYVALVAGLLGAVYPQYRIRVVNMGVSGNTVRDLAQRWQSDVLDLQPDWLSIMIGINDVWRQFDCPLQREQHVPLPEYEATLERLVAETLPALRGMVLMTPFFIEPSRQDAMRRRMDEYGAAVKRIARRHKLILVDTQAAFDRVLRYCHPAALAWDRVHPNTVGHMILARAFLNAVGFEW
ncbi:MAG: SGNH/GDSL hydrolase family protein [Planctomycetota bacterium]|nr:SGNH/GDSL hydrolase family protein [Planctomycetota bacterium]